MARRISVHAGRRPHSFRQTTLIRYFGVAVFGYRNIQRRPRQPAVYPPPRMRQIAIWRFFGNDLHWMSYYPTKTFTPFPKPRPSYQMNIRYYMVGKPSTKPTLL